MAAEQIADRTRSATTIRDRRTEWIRAGIFGRLQHCYERREEVIDAFFDLADPIITVRNLIRQAWTTYCWDGRPARRPRSPTYPRELLRDWRPGGQCKDASR